MGYYIINNAEILGGVSIMWKGELNNSILTPVISCAYTNDTRRDPVYTPGYLTRIYEFFCCPLSIGYVQIDKIIEKIEEFMIVKERGKEIVKKSTHKTVEFWLTIFSKDFTQHRQEVLVIKGGIVNLAKYINSVNVFIDGGYSPDKLSIKKLLSFSNSIARSVVIAAINKLRFQFYDNSRYVPRKDNIFWAEIEVYGLSENVYLRALIRHCFALQQHHEVQVTEFGLVLVTNRSSYALPDYERRLMEIDSHSRIEWEWELKSNLLVDMIKSFDQSAYNSACILDD